MMINGENLNWSWTQQEKSGDKADYTKTMELSGKITIVTGRASGLGAQTVHRLSQVGFKEEVKPLILKENAIKMLKL